MLLWIYYMCLIISLFSRLYAVSLLIIFDRVENARRKERIERTILLFSAFGQSSCYSCKNVG